jgi:elongation factor P
MITSNQITPGMTLKVEGKIYRVDSSVKVTVAKGTPFIKTKLRDLISDAVTEKNFKLNQEVEEVSLVEHTLEFLYPEGKEFLFLDVGDLEQVKISPRILGDKINLLKEGAQIKAMFYGDSIFSIELPQFLELMVIKIEHKDAKVKGGSAIKLAVLETGAKVEVPAFIEVGDVIKIDSHTNEYVQRV